MPKSSSATRTPMSCRASKRARAVSTWGSTADSVTSRTSCEVGRPLVARHSSTIVTKPGLARSTPETLTCAVSGMRKVEDHCWIWALAVDSTMRPSSEIRPNSSATGTNRAGETCPCTGWLHRTRASNPTIEPWVRSTSGW